MSRAFTKEGENESTFIAGERPISPHRNLVTREGLAEIEATLTSLREEFAKAEAEGDRERIALVSRDLRYWQARRETAEVSVPEPDSDVVRFGMTVTLIGPDGERHRFKIVGEDEADTAKGKISHASPLARALFGKGAGEVVTVNGKEWEIEALAVEA